ncbi:MAG: homogentisate 1,2-dioxygenase [Phycisphaerales bacterium]|jgi:homogentisate 1,2-dioxygenase|nr:homogentisate 1,2-dioxygenase [Phycisphaerales bacterium]
MAVYRTLGQIPRKRHIRLARDPQTSFLGEGLAYEHVITTAGFDRAYSITYHLRPPTRVKRIEAAGQIAPAAVEGQPLRHRHLRSQELPRAGDPIRGRVPLLFNDDMTCYRCRPAQEQAVLYRNGGADEVIFVFDGAGMLESPYGVLPYMADDYIVIPRGTTYRLVPNDVKREDHLILESAGPVRIPSKYLNPDGQIQLGAPYSERDFHGPHELLTIDREEETEILVKDGRRLTRTVMSHHPFDVIGWDGMVYPYTFNAMDFEPLTGTVHLPPPFQQTFECRGFVICTFAPRHLDHHPESIKVPYVHSNTEADEVLFYVRGNFGSRRGVGSGSLSHHPAGIPHGPHPGTIKASMGHDRTEELAVMFDTERPLAVTAEAMRIDDPKYPYSWIEAGADVGDGQPR